MMDLPKRNNEPGMSITLRLTQRVINRLDDARGHLNRQQWIRETVVRRLKDEGFMRGAERAAE